MDLPSKRATQILETDFLWKTDARMNNPQLVTPTVLRETVFAGWRDLRANLVGAPKGVGAAALTAFGPTGSIKQLAFALSDSVYSAMHINHDIKEGSTSYFHVHWSTDGTNVNPVHWRIHYTGAEIGGVYGDEQTIDIIGTPSGTAWTHEVATDTTGIIVPAKHAVYSFEVERIVNGATDNTDTVFGLFLDLYYLSDMYGVTNGPG